MSAPTFVHEYVASFAAEGGWLLETSAEPVEADRAANPLSQWDCSVSGDTARERGGQQRRFPKYGAGPPCREMRERRQRRSH